MYGALRPMFQITPLDALVKLVRKKIDDKNQPSFIQTIRGVGYKVSTEYV